MINIKAPINPTKEDLAIASAQELKRAQNLAKNITSMFLSGADASVIVLECALMEKHINSALNSLNNSIFS